MEVGGGRRHRSRKFWVSASTMLSLLLLCCCQRSAALEASDVTLPASYEPSQPPTVPVNVNLDFVINEVLDVDDKKNELQLEGSLYLTWNDPRIQIRDNLRGGSAENLILDLDWRKRLWLPDLWVESLRHFDIHKSLDDQVTLELFKNGTLIMWQSVSVKTSCPMNFNFYPFDTQVCQLRFSANGLDISKQTFSGSIQMGSAVHYCQGALQYSDFEMRQDGNFSFISVVSGREWPQIRAQFLLSRRKLDHILQTFQPTGCLVCLSWISFLIPPYIVPGRMVLLVTLLLVVFSTYQNEHQQSPRSSDLKALDIWFVGCMLFVLAAICEYAVLLFLKRLFIKRRRQQEKADLKREESKQQGGDDALKSVSEGVLHRAGVLGGEESDVPDSPLPPVEFTSSAANWFHDLKRLPSSPGPPPSSSSAAVAAGTGHRSDTRRSTLSTVFTPRYRSAASRMPRKLVQVSAANSPSKHSSVDDGDDGGGFANKMFNSALDDNGDSGKTVAVSTGMVVEGDSGSEYGDINDTNMEGEELLERIDENAVKIFPCCFLVFNVVYWCHYLLRSDTFEDLVIES